MNLIDNISSDANQLTQIVLDDGTLVNVNLIFRPAIQRWTMDVLRGTFSVGGMNICVHPNLLREWRNIIPFGLACVTTDSADPIDVEDFTNGRAQLYVLTAQDVLDIEATILGAGV